jgi:hypothetical protein
MTDELIGQMAREDMDDSLRASTQNAHRLMRGNARTRRRLMAATRNRAAPMDADDLQAERLSPTGGRYYWLDHRNDLPDDLPSVFVDAFSE